jgi:hypothetical protein
VAADADDARVNAVTAVVTIVLPLRMGVLASAFRH